MNRENVEIGMGRKLAGIALGALLSVAAPILVITEVFSLVTVVLLPAVALVALYRWSGRGPALFSALLILAFDLWFLGVTFMLMALFATILPPLLLLRIEDRPFREQMKFSIAAFGVGMLAAVIALYLGYGGNIIERILAQLPRALRLQSGESLAPMLEMVSGLLQRPVNAEDFFELYDSLIRQMIPIFQQRLPELLFSGALITAILCTWLSNRMRLAQGAASPHSFLPLREWALPASTTGGLLLLLAVSGLLRIFNVKNGVTVLYAVYGIAAVAFCVQALSSMARRMHISSLRPRTQRAILIVMLVLCFLGTTGVMAVYGCASAIFGSRGVLRQRMQNEGNDDRFGGDE